MNCYEPEGRKIAGTANQRYCGSLEGLREAMAEGVILEGWGARISGARPVSYTHLEQCSATRLPLSQRAA